MCRVEQDQGHGLADPVESEAGLNEKACKSCEVAWSQKHGYALAPGRRLVSTQLAPMHSMSHVFEPNPRDFSLLPVRRMKLQDGSLGAQGTDAELTSSNHVYLKIRAFFFSYAFVNMDQQIFFNLGAAETVNDKILGYLYAVHAHGRPSVAFFAEAWENTARVFQLGVRSGKMLCDLTEADSTWQHFWTAYTPTPRAQPTNTDAGKGLGQGLEKRDKGAGKNSKKGDTELLRNIQQKKDRQIAQLKRELEVSKSAAGSSTSTPSRGGWWKSQRRW